VVVVRDGSRSLNKTHLDVYVKGKLHVILADFLSWRIVWYSEQNRIFRKLDLLISLVKSDRLIKISFLHRIKPINLPRKLFISS